MRVRRITTTAAMTTLLSAASLIFAGVAFAESESSAQINQTSTVEVTNTQNVTVNNQVTSSTTVDGVTTTVTTDTGYSDVQPTNDDTPAVNLDQQVAPSASDQPELTAITDTPILDIAETAAVTAPQQTTSSSKSGYNFSQLGSSDSGIFGGPTAAAAATPVGQAPAQPVSGALHQFDAVLATLISSARNLFDPSQTDARLPLAASAVLALALVIIAAPTVGQYVNRLRRAGYTHAARSDMSAATVFSIVTPLKVSFAWAVSPAASSSFYRSNWLVASGY